MRRRAPRWIAVSVSILLMMLASQVVTQAATAQTPDDLPGFRVQGRHLYDRFGDKVVLVGINKMVIWTDRDGLPAFPEIAKTGANVVRIVWLTEGTAKELDTVIANAVNHQLIPMVDCHDSTGEWEKLQDCVDYWVRPDILPVLKRHEAYLLINIANEAGQGVVSPVEFRAAYELAIRRIRAAGLHVPLIIDAQGFGQNINDLQRNGPYLIEADPDHNLMFSIHMWWPTAWRGPAVDQLVIDEIAESVEMDLPLLIGEFASLGPGCTCCIPYRTIIEEAHRNEIGYLAWSWGPGNSDCAEMDMTEDGTFDTLYGWGLEVAITSTHSIQNIAVRPDWIVRATPVPPPTPAPTPTPLSGPPGLISIGRPVDVSSVEKEELAGPNAVDGRLNTRWASTYDDPQHIVVDLGEVHPIARIVLEWEAAYGREYKLQASDDGETWIDLVHVTDGDGGRDDHLVTADARYVRMLGLERGTEWGYSLYEFWVFDRADAPLPEADVTGSVSPEPDKRPDLVITELRWSPDPVLVEDTVTFEALVENHGARQSPMQPVNCVFQIGGETIATGEVTKPVAPGGEITCVASPWKPETPGEFIFVAWVDGDPTAPAPGVPQTAFVGDVEEADENNNMLTGHGRVRTTAPPATPTSAPSRTPAPTEPAATTAPTPPRSSSQAGEDTGRGSLVWILALTALFVIAAIALVARRWARRRPG
ncbi:MAG: discoidin domain-containing protein [Anaerolineae bacterium]